ncbi:uncharacterized protein [Dermacentor albipictus]|uniref:uncharacterized protein n=1 Tax=Dermacentor albipictus TaxID=60249 RepID=UPI0038FCDE58
MGPLCLRNRVRYQPADQLVSLNFNGCVCDPQVPAAYIGAHTLFKDSAATGPGGQQLLSTAISMPILWASWSARQSAWCLGARTAHLVVLCSGGLVTPHAMDLVASRSSYLVSCCPLCSPGTQHVQCSGILLPAMWTWCSALPSAWCLTARFADLVTTCSCEVVSRCPSCRPGGQLFRSRAACSQRISKDLPTTDFGESLDLKQPGARATEQPLTQTGEVQLERQVSNLRQRGHFHCHDDVAIRTVAENYDKRVVPHTKIKFANTADQKPRRRRQRR